MTAQIVRVICAANGDRTPHDNRYVVSWNPHTPFGVCEVTSTNNRTFARRFAPGQAQEQWATISNVQPTRWDGKPNRPLCGLTIELIGDDAP